MMTVHHYPQPQVNTTRMNRRQLFKAIAAGGVITAAGLWVPGKLISIPKKLYVFGDSTVETFGTNAFGSASIRWINDVTDLITPYRSRILRAKRIGWKHIKDVNNKNISRIVSYGLNMSDGSFKSLPIRAYLMRY